MTTTRKMTSLQRSWPVLVICCTVVFSAMSLVNGMGAIFTDIMDVFQVSRATASLAQSVNIGLLFLTGIITGHFVQRFGPRVTVITGSVLATVGCIIAFLATHIVQVIVGLGVLGGIGMSCNVLTPLTVIGTVFHDVRSVAVSIASICIAAGSIVFPVVLTRLTEQYSLRGTFLILAAINCQMILCGALIGIFVPRSPGKTAVISETVKKEAEEAGEADDVAVVDTARNRVHHGNPQKSGDGEEEEEVWSVERSRGDESTCFLTGAAKDHKASVYDGVLSGKLSASQDDSEKSEYVSNLCHHDPDVESDHHHHHTEPDLEPEMQGKKVNHEDSRLLSINNCVEIIDTSIETHPPLEDKNGEKHLFCCGKCPTASCTDLLILRDVRFVAFSLLGSSAGLYLYQPVIFMTDMVMANQMTAEDGAFFLTIFFVGNVLGRVLAGVLYKFLRSGTLHVYSVSLAIDGVVCMLFLFTREYSHFVIVSISLGLCFGVVSSNFQMVHLEILGPSRYTVGLGYASTVEGVFALLSGPYAGLIRDLSNSYEPLYYIACVHGLVIGSLLVFTALRYGHRAS